MRSFEELRDTGLLWYINRSVFHPRGYALTLHLDDDMKCEGWSLLGDGKEPWSFGIGVKEETELFNKVKELLNG